MSETQVGPGSAVGRHLRADAEDLVAHWLDRLRSSEGPAAVGGLSDQVMRGEVPALLLALADQLESGSDTLPAEALERAASHGRLRRDQGYSLQALLVELDHLADVLHRSVARRLAPAEVDATVGFEIASRLSSGLRAVHSTCAGAFEGLEAELRRRLFKVFETYKRAVLHELREPLNTVSIVSHTLRSEKIIADPERRNEQLDALQEVAKRSARFLDNLRVLAVAAGAQAGERLVELRRAVEVAYQEFAPLAAEAGVELRIAKQLPAVRAESIVLYLALVNLIGNGIKFRDPEASPSWVRVSARALEDQGRLCQLEVEDNGLGIPAAALPRIQEPGFRAHPGTARGTGLGLHLVGSLLRERGGALEVRSTEGEGTTITCRFRCLDAGAC